MTDMAYSYKKLQGPEQVQLQDLHSNPPIPSSPHSIREEDLPPSHNPSFFHRNPKTTFWATTMLVTSLVLLSALSLTRAAVLEKKQAASTTSSTTTKVPQLFQTSPELFTGILTFPKLPSFIADFPLRSNRNRPCALLGPDKPRSLPRILIHSKPPS